MTDTQTQTERVRQPTSDDSLAREIAELMLSKKAKDVVIMDLHGLTDLTDYFLVCTGDSNTQIRAIADGVLDGLAEEGVKPYRTEGWQGGNWIILDFVEVVVHIFYAETRTFYNIERLWADAKFERITDQESPAAQSPGIGDTTEH